MMARWLISAFVLLFLVGIGMEFLAKATDSQTKAANVSISTPPERTRPQDSQTKDIAKAETLADKWIKIGTRAPAFTLKTLDGNPLSLADYRGRPVLLNMWTTWCGVCLEEIPQLKKLAASGEISVIGINLTSEEWSRRDVRTFVEQTSIQYPIVLDPRGIVVERYNITGVPTSFLLNEKGIVLDVIRGVVSAEHIMRKWRRSMTGRQ